MPIAYPYNMSDWYGYDQDCVPLKQIRLTASSSPSSTGMCGVATAATIFYHNGSSSTPSVGSTIYSDISGTTVYSFIGYKGVSVAGASSNLATKGIKVNASGVVQSPIGVCT